MADVRARDCFYRAHWKVGKASQMCWAIEAIDVMAFHLRLPISSSLSSWHLQTQSPVR